MTTLTDVAEAMQALLTTEADELAHDTGFIQRQRKLTGASFAQTLVFTAMAHPAPTQSQRHSTAVLVGVEASRQALEKRLDAKAAGFLRELLRSAIAKAVASPVVLPLLQRFTAVVVLDSSVVALPDALAHLYRGGRSGTTTGTKAAVKLTVGLDLLAGTLHGPELSDGRTGDLNTLLAQATPSEGSLEIADLGYFNLTKFARWAKAGAYFLSRLKVHTAVYDRSGHRLDLLEMLRAAGNRDVDRDVQLGCAERVACRVIARPVPPEVAALRQKRLREKNERRGERTSALALALCAWTILVTNVPRAQLTVDEAMALARMRWQIELIFKNWKSGGGGIDVCRSAKPWTVLCELYGKLLAQVVRHWVIVVGAWSVPDRSVKKAGEIVQSLAKSLAEAVGSLDRLGRVLSHAQQMMRSAARMEKRKARPNAHDLIICHGEGP